MTLAVVLAIVQIFGMFGVGWLARRRGYIGEEDLTRWSAFILDFLTPPLVFHSIVRDLDVDRLRELWPLPCIGFGGMALGAVVGLACGRLLGRHATADVRRTFHHLCAINNYGFLPIIIVQNLWGATGLAQLFFLHLGSTLGYWTIGIGLLSGGAWRGAVRNLATPSLLGLVLALVLAVTGWRRYVPDVVVNTAGAIGAAATPCFILLSGAGLYPWPRMQHKGIVAGLTLLRLGLLPALTVGVLYLLPLARDVRELAIIVALMPAAASSAILARRYGGDPDFASEVIVVTTLLCLVTIPLSVRLLLGA